MVWGLFVRGPLVKAKLSEEISRISPPRQSQLIERTSLNKYIRVWLHEEYSTPLTLEELRRHYDAKLEESGWWLLKEHTASAYLTEATYCKEDYTASLDYLGTYGDDLQGVYRLYLNSGGECKLVKGGVWRILPFDSWIFLLIASSAWLLFAILVYRATRIMDKKELVQLELWTDSKSKLIAGVQGARLSSLICFVLGLVGSLFGGYCVAMYVFNWILDVFGSFRPAVLGG